MDPTYPLGVDILEWNKARAFYREHRGRLKDFLCPAESDFVKRADRPEEAFALVFSAKEAVFKALGAPWMGVSGFRDVELSPKKDFSFRVKGRLKKYFSPGIPLRITFQKTGRHVVAACHPVFAASCAGT